MVDHKKKMVILMVVLGISDPGERITGKNTAAAFGTLFVGLLFMAPQEGSAAPGEHLNWGHQLDAGDEACPSGDQVLNIGYKISNSLNSGTGTNDYGRPWWHISIMSCR